MTMPKDAAPPQPRGRKVRVGDRIVVAHGGARHLFGDVYHYCMGASWPVFFAGFAAVFFVVNTVFATLYFIGGSPIANARPGFEDLFYFSIETLATVGYGDMHPQTRYGHLVTTVEIFTGMSIMAVMTGLVFARFSRPRALVLFADVLVLSLHDGKPTLMLRMANQRYDMIAGATAKLWLTRNEPTLEGAKLRRVRELPLERAENPLFALSWTIFHAVDAASPLYGEDAESLAAAQASFIVTFTGQDEASGQSMHARRMYSHEDLAWQKRYADILDVDEDERVHIDYSRFHHTQDAPL